MNYLTFFANNNPSQNESITIREPAPEQLLLADAVLSVMSPVIEGYGFLRHSVSVIKNITWIVFSKQQQYIAISSSTLPVDYPYYYEIILGEAGKGDYDRQNRQSVTIAQLATTAGATAGGDSYNFPGRHVPGQPVDIDAKRLQIAMETAKKDLLQYGIGFLEGDLNLFRQAIQQWHKNTRA